MSTLEVALITILAGIFLYFYLKNKNDNPTFSGIRLIEILDHGDKEKQFVISCHACKTVTLVHKALVFPAALSREWVTHCPKCEQNRLIAHSIDSEKGKALIASTKKQ